MSTCMALQHCLYFIARIDNVVSQHAWLENQQLALFANAASLSAPIVNKLY